MEPILVTDNMQETVAYYIDSLGMRYGSAIYADAPDRFVSDPDRNENERDLVLAMFRSSKGEKVIYRTRAESERMIPAIQNAPLGASAVFYVQVEDLAAMYEQVRDKVDVIAEPHASWCQGTFQEFLIRDCNGYLIGFTQQVPKEKSEE